MRHYSTLCHPEAGPRVECGVTQSPHRMQSAPLPQKKYTHSLKKYSEIFGLYYKPIYIYSINTFQGETI